MGVNTVSRPDPPDSLRLTDEQTDEWWAIVNRMPADWFPRETHAVLAQLCRHVIRAKRLAQLLDAKERAKTVDVEEYVSLLRAEEAQSRAIASLATRLRITQQSLVSANKTRTGDADFPKPWDYLPKL